MVDDEQSSPSCWALLIGIDLYPDNGETRPLKGCVRDVRQFQQCLKSRTDVYTIVLTASDGDHIDGNPLRKRPPENEQQWPTLENVRSAITMITESARPGDAVHIHFSGHGLRRKTRSEEYGDHENGDLALVLFDSVSGQQYLQGLELAKMLETMVEKGLKPVLVLDCCYSGAVLRDDNGNTIDQQMQGAIREAIFNPEVDRQSTYVDLSREMKRYVLPRRDARALRDWFLSPDGYAIFAACGPNEVSRELNFDSKDSSGPLSYFLLLALQAMQRGEVQLSLKSVYDYVAVQYIAGSVKQTPRRYGNENLGFFTYLFRECDPLETRVRWATEHNQLILEAGQAHGVIENDQYKLLPPWDDECNSKNLNEAIIATVGTVYALTSVLELLKTESDSSRVRNAWRAIPYTRRSHRRVFVELASRLHQHQQWREHINAANFLTSSLGTVRTFLPPPFSSFAVNIKDDSEIQILDERRCAIPQLPTFPSASSSAISDTVAVLDHVARFKYIENLENMSSDTDFERSVGLQLVHPVTGQIVTGIGDELDVAHGETVLLHCVNLSEERQAYLSVLNLGPLWQIENFLSKKHGDYKELPIQAVQDQDDPWAF